MASSASRKSEQDLVTGGLVENDLIEEIHAWYKHAIEHAMITIFDLPAKRKLNDVETTAWKHFEEMIKSCEQSLFKLAENVTIFFSEIKDDDFEYVPAIGDEPTDPEIITYNAYIATLHVNDAEQLTAEQVKELPVFELISGNSINLNFVIPPTTIET